MDKVKKVLFTATVDSHILHFHIPYLKMFKDMGYETHVATNSDEAIPYCDKKYKISFERSPFKLNNLKAIKQLKKVVEEEKFDIIHCHTPMGSVVTRLASKHARKAYGTRVIYTAHGFHFYKGAPKINWLIFYPVEKYLSKYTDDLITINNEDYELAIKKFKAKRTHYVPGVGVDPKKFDFELSQEERHELRKSLGIKDDDIVLIYVAELNKNKNQIMAIKAMEKLIVENSKYKLLLVGKDSYNGEYQRLVQELKLENNVIFTGYRKDVPKLMKISNIAISTSLREGLPVNLIEATMCGLPIVATNCRGNRDISKILVDIDNVDEFKNKILHLKIQNNNLNEELKLENIMKKYLDIYNESLKKQVLFLRSTSVVNDSRAKKEIDFYKENNCNVIVLGWNRQKLNIPDTEDIKYIMYEKKSEYGNGLKNIFKLLGFEMYIYRKVKKYKNNIDIIHACDFDTAFVAYKAFRKSRTKFLYDIYDFYVDCHNLKKFKSAVENKDIKLINNSDIVLICSEKRKQQIAKSNPKKVLIIHNSPEVVEKNTEMKPFDEKCVKVCYVGILQDDRLLVEVCNEVKNSKEVELHIGGFGKYETYFENMAKKYHNIKYYGSMNYDEVLKLEKDCDILFATYNPEIPNHKYSAPNKVYEAMALGKPIIVCKNTGIDEMVSNNKIGYAIDYSAKEFMDKIKNINELEYLSMAKNAKKVYLEKYSWEKMKALLKEEIL